MQMAVSSQTQRDASAHGQPLLEKTVDANNLYMLKKQSDKLMEEKSMKSC